MRSTHVFLFLFLLIKGFHCMYNEGPSFTLEPPSKVEFLNEKGIELNCTASGRPSPSITWSSTPDGSPLFDIPGLRFTSSHGSLIFNSFPAESFRPDVHSATYRCIASNGFGTLVSRDVRLRAVVKQSFEPEVHNVRATKDFPAVLQCVLPNFLRDFVTVTSWIHGSLNILPSSGFEPEKYYMLDDGQLLIWQVSLLDSYSSYQCRTFHRLTGQTSVSAPAKIIVTEGHEPSRPVIEQIEQKNIVVKENDRVVMPCIAYGRPRPLHTWFKREGNRLTPVIDDSLDETRPNSRLTIDGTGVIVRHGALLINSVRVSNKGIYLCNVTNSEGTDSIEFHLTVRTSLTVNLQPDKLTVDLGKNAEFNCFATSEPQPSVQWMKDGRLLRPGNTAGRIRFIGQNRIQVIGVQREDQGIYQCLARNDYNSQQRSAQLWLGDSPPKFLYRFIEQSLQPGPAISLKCSATGNPTPHITWLLDGFELPKSDRFLMGQYSNAYGESISHVNITSVRIEDGGTYSCIANNHAGKEVHSAALNIYGAPYVRSVPDITAVAGKALTIKCPVGGGPIKSIVFFKDGKQLPWNSRQEVRDGTLLVKNIERPEDEGSYKCVATSMQGQSAQMSLKVRVVVGPKILPFQFSDESLYVGDTVQVQCVLTRGDEANFQFQWSKDNIQLENFHGHSSTLNALKGLHIAQVKVGQRKSSILTIDALSPMHSGNYTCTVSDGTSNVITSTNYTAQLTVNAAIKISKFSFEDGLVAGRGMRTQVICSATEGRPVNITWFRDNVQLHHSALPDRRGDMTMVTGGDAIETDQHLLPAGVSIKRFDTFSSIFSISNVSAVHSARYKCTLADDLSQTSHESPLLVQVPPRFVIEPRDEQITVGTQVLIDCQAEGTPTPSIKWKQLVGPLEKKEFREMGYTPGVLVAENGSLIISRVTEYHAGYYSCHAIQQQHQQPSETFTEISKLIHLLVNAPPRIKARPPKEIVRRQETAILKCEATGDEPIHFSWFSKGIRLVENMDSRYSVNANNQLSELTIRDVSPDDRGDYDCVSSNSFGQDQIRISLLVQERPQTPKNLHVVEKTSRSVALSWTMLSHQDSPVLNYMLSYKEESENWEEQQTRKKSASGDHNSITVKNLQPATNYQFRLIARNSQGNSEPSSISVLTDTESPSGPPLDITVEAISSTQLRVIWNPPRREERNGQILGYNIRYRSNRNELGGQFNWTRVEASSGDNAQLSKVISGLERYEEYHVAIQAFNEKGPGPFSEIQKTTTQEDVPSAPPEGIQCAPLTPHSLQLHWEPPPSNFIHGNLQGFRVVAEAVEALPQINDNDSFNYSPSEFDEKVSASTSTIMHNLQPFTNYSVQVSAVTRVGEGVQSAAIFCETKESVPSEPAAIKAIVSATESVIVSWLPPRMPNGNVVKFNVYIRISGQGREIRTVKRNLPSHTLHYEVSDLKRRETYEAWVSAESSAGEGQSTVSVPFSASPNSNPIPAAIISFGTVVTAAWKTSILLKCQHVGASVNIQWLKRDVKIVESARVKIHPNSSLSIDIVERSDSSGNISCLVKNAFGADVITYVLKVQVPPTAPLLHATSVTSSTVRLQWKQGDNGGAAILGFTLIYRREGGEWEELNLNRKLSSYEVTSLSCGTSYEFFLTGFNKIGSGEPSETILISTKGSRPVVPPPGDFLQADSTSIHLNFSEWTNASLDCHITSYTVEYKTKGTNWISIKGDDKNIVEINQLLPETEYKLRIVAHNEAGTSSGEFTVSTSLHKGGLMSSTLSHHVPFYQDIQIILPIIISLASIFVAIAGVLLCWKKKNYRGSGMLQNSSLALRDSDRDYTVIRAKYISDCDQIPDSAEDIYPYATFQLPEKPNLAGNITDAYLYGPGPTQMSSGGDTIPVRTMHRGGTLPGHGTNKRRKSRTNNGIRNEPTTTDKAGESDEYDSLGSDSDDKNHNPMLNNMDSVRGNRRYSNRLNPTQFLNDETLIVSDRDRERSRKSLPRSRQKVPLPVVGMIPAKFLDETSFIYGPNIRDDRILLNHHGQPELNHMNCDIADLNRVGRRSDQMFASAVAMRNSDKGMSPLKKANTKIQKSSFNPGDHQGEEVHYTIAV